MNCQTKSALSEPRKKLVQSMQALSFGLIENLEIRQGEPVFNPSPRMVRDIKLGGDNSPRQKHQGSDFLLKHQIVELCSLLDAIANSTICIEVKHGLPFRVLVEQSG
jgi:hypothetical protein